MVECGATSIYTNAKTGYPNPKPLQSVKKWQRTFFYVRTPDNEDDCHNLPEFMLDLPNAKTNWGIKVVHGDTDLDRMASRVRELHEEGLEALISWLDSSCTECSHSSADLAVSTTCATTWTTPGRRPSG